MSHKPWCFASIAEFSFIQFVVPEVSLPDVVTFAFQAKKMSGINLGVEDFRLKGERGRRVASVYTL